MTRKRENFERALAALREAVATPPIEARDFAGIVKSFEFVYELSWKWLRLRLEESGHEARSARDAFKTAYQLGWIGDESIWLSMIGDRNLTVHTYNREFATALCQRITQQYLPAFESLSNV